jgi:hypothetical protein
MMRFGQQDPMGYVDGMNLYGVERSNPTGHLDPMGLSSATLGYMSLDQTRSFGGRFSWLIDWSIKPTSPHRGFILQKVDMSIVLKDQTGKSVVEPAPDYPFVESWQVPPNSSSAVPAIDLWDNKIDYAMQKQDTAGTITITGFAIFIDDCDPPLVNKADRKPPLPSGQLATMSLVQFMEIEMSYPGAVAAGVSRSLVATFDTSKRSGYRTQVSVNGVPWA